MQFRIFDFNEGNSKKILNDGVVKNFFNRTSIPVHQYLINGDLIPLIHWQDMWDDYEVATLDNLKTKKVWKYCGTDTKTNYEQNLKDQPQDWYYRENKVNYTLNSLGYRTREFNEIDWENSILMFGCSHVFGLGVDDKDTIPFYLEQITGKNVINLGIPGGSLMSMLHTSFCIKEKFPKPLQVIFSWTSLDRLTIFNFNSVKLYGGWNMNSIFFKKIGEQKIDIVLKNMFYLQMIKSIWKDYCNCYEFAFDSFYPKHIFPWLDIDRFNYSDLLQIDPARDFLHLGPKANLKVASELSSRINLK